MFRSISKPLLGTTTVTIPIQNMRPLFFTWFGKTTWRSVIPPAEPYPVLNSPTASHHSGGKNIIKVLKKNPIGSPVKRELHNFQISNGKTG